MKQKNKTKNELGGKSIKERPILFSGPMVRAILEGRKSQTRRIIKPSLLREGWDTAFNPVTFLRGLPLTPFQDPSGSFGDRIYSPKWQIDEVVHATCPYGKPGDRLWGRETWATVDNIYRMRNWPGRPHVPGDTDIDDEEILESATIYRADGGCQWCDEEDPDKTHWRPSIHMPKWTSRIELEITRVWVERLRDISEEDAVAEGFGG